MTTWCARIKKSEPCVQISPRMRYCAMQTMSQEQEEEVYLGYKECPSLYLLAVSNNTASKQGLQHMTLENPPTPEQQMFDAAEQELLNMQFNSHIKTKNVPCPKCKTSMITVTRQLRGGDEGMSGVLMCPRKDCQ